MTQPTHIKLHIGSLRLRGMNQADATALVQSLQNGLENQLRANPDALTSASTLRLNVPNGTGAQRGAAIAAQMTKQGGGRK